MKRPSIFFLIILFNYCFSQEKQETIIIKEAYTPLKTYENDKVVKNSRKKEVFSYIYKISVGKDTIKYYNDTYTPADKINPITFVLKNTENDNSLILLVNEEGKNPDSMLIRFMDQLQTISINQNDSYHLNPAYYSELKNSIYANKNILDLTDLLDDHLGDYPYQLKYLNRISSYKKYKKQNFKIIKATLKTNRTQSDTQDTWNVLYKYDKNNTLQTISKNSSDGETSFDKKLLLKKMTEYKYKVYNNVESRYEDNDEITFDVNKGSYSIMQSHFQFGLVKEKISQTKTILFKKE